MLLLPNQEGKLKQTVNGGPQCRTAGGGINNFFDILFSGRYIPGWLAILYKHA